MKLIFATHNKHKVTEIRPLLSSKITLVGLEEIKCVEDIPETGDTLAANALQKAIFVYEKYKSDCFADDTGLEIDKLNGRPGVFSARYAGENKSADKNIEKVLAEMHGIADRGAVFKTVIALIIDGKPTLFEGSVKGIIAENKIGTNGFGYDPIFIPEGGIRSFAQMTLEEKNKLSQRAMAVKKFVEYLSNLA